MRYAIVVLTIAALAVATATPGLTCSTFVASFGSHVVLGRNSDASAPFLGQFVVNKRGVEKIALSWGVLGPGSPNERTMHWVSRYGSVTMTLIGREFPDGGMNEKGMAVEEMSLDESVLPRVDGRPSMSQSQWIQYQLDNYASVDEVVAHVNDYNLTGWGWHFTVGDSTGACAAIEFIGGKPSVVRGPAGQACVQTNSTQAESRAYLASLADKSPPADLSSLARFARASRDLAVAARPLGGDEVTHAFAVLDDVSAGKNTIRTTVHDMTDRKIYFRTVGHPNIKSITLSSLDFSPRSPVKVLDVDALLTGDATDKFRPYSRAANRDIARAFFDIVVHPIVPARQKLDQELAAADMSETQYVDLLAAYPETTRIVGP